MISDLTPTQIEKQYRDIRSEFEECTRRAEAISRAAGGRKLDSSPEHQKKLWASVIFTKLTVTAHSLLRIAPRTAPFPETGASWDSSALASLSRNLSECYFVFFYICVDKVSNDDEWLMRLNLMQIRDNMARWRMFRDFDPNHPDMPGFLEHQDDLRKRLEMRQHFVALPSKRQSELLKGERDPFTQDELLDRMGEDKANFRGIYRHFSAHTHSTPLSFYRMPERDLGRGIETPSEKQLMTLALGVAGRFLRRAIRDMVVFFPDAEEPGVSPPNRAARRRR